MTIGLFDELSLVSAARIELAFTKISIRHDHQPGRTFGRGQTGELSP
jgi:hypothetical protein